MNGACGWPICRGLLSQQAVAVRWGADTLHSEGKRRIGNARQPAASRCNRFEGFRRGIVGGSLFGREWLNRDIDSSSLTSRQLQEYFSGPQYGNSDVYWIEAVFIRNLRPKNNRSS